MRKCFVHIGTHKTGTTSIQSALENSRLPLAKHGFLYPKTGISPGHFGHHNIAWELADDHRFRPDNGTVDDLLKEIDQTDHDVIISSEDFECAAHWPERFENFIMRLRQHALDVIMVAYFRNQIDYARSLYLTLLLLGYDTSFDDFVSGIIEDRRIEWKDWVFAFSYRDFLKQLPEGTTILARPYDRVSCVVTDFISNLGLTPADLNVDVAVRLNQHPPVSAAFSAFYLNRTGRRLNSEAPWITPIIALAFNGDDAEIKDRTKERLIAAFRESNASMDSRFGISGFAALPEKIVGSPAESNSHPNFETIFSPTTVRLIDDVVRAHTDLIAERDELVRVRDGVIAERDNVAEERDALLASRSWRLTAPLRRMRILFAAAVGKGRTG